MEYNFKTLAEVTFPKFFSKDQVFNFAKPGEKRVPGNYWEELLKLCYEYPESKSLYVEYRHVENYDLDLAKYLINNPNTFFSAAKEAIASMSFPTTDLPDIEVRITSMPDAWQIPISRLRKEHLNKLISVLGVVSKATEIRPVRTKTAFQCLRCGHVTIVEQSEETDALQEPFAGCENDTCGKKGPFKIKEDESEYIDYQILKIQEPLDTLRGRQPEFLYVACSEELAGACKPGDKVVIVGVLQGRPRVKKDGKRTRFLDFILVANSIMKSTRDFENIPISQEEEKQILELSKKPNIDKIIYNSIAPSIFGMENVKQGVALQLFSGTGRRLNDGTWQRGDIHILLVGDPGIAKSQILKFVADFAPRAIMVSGQSASGAGLTGAAVHDDFDGRWAIEAGALTMVSGSEDFEGGICCVDEVDKMKENDRSMIHGALEQQCVDIAKAGVFAHLPTQCAFLGAANPKYGRYDQYESIATQFNLGDALLSRMDLLYVIRDVPDQAFDEKLALYVLDERTDGNGPGLIDLELLRKYIAYAKTHCFPVMTPEARDYIAKFYVSTRNAGSKVKDSVPVTVRALHAARRLATAHARMRLSSTVDLKDAVAACKLLIDNLSQVGIDPDTGALDATVLEAGTSGSQRSNIKKIKEIIERLSKADIVHQEAKLDRVIEMSLEAGIKDPEGLIKKMKQKGDIISPTQSTLKLVK